LGFTSKPSVSELKTAGVRKSTPVSIQDFVVRFRRPFTDKPEEFRVRGANFVQCFLQPLDDIGDAAIQTRDAIFATNDNASGLRISS
jgi:hypothetical protein